MDETIDGHRSGSVGGMDRRGYGRECHNGPTMVPQCTFHFPLPDIAVRGRCGSVTLWFDTTTAWRHIESKCNPIRPQNVPSSATTAATTAATDATTANTTLYPLSAPSRLGVLHVGTQACLAAWKELSQWYVAQPAPMAALKCGGQLPHSHRLPHRLHQLHAPTTRTHAPVCTCRKYLQHGRGRQFICTSNVAM